MKIGLSTATFFGKILTENSFEKISELGIEVAEVFLTTFYEYDDKFTTMLAETNNKYGLEIFSVHSLNNHYEPELFNTVKRTRDDAEVFFDMVCRGAEKLNANYYTFHGPSMLKIRNYKLDYERIGTRLIELNQIAKKYNVTVTYENVSWAYYNQPEFYTEIINYIPELKVCLDIKQAMQSYRYNNGIGPNDKLNSKQQNELRDYTYKFAQIASKGLINVHLCDYDECGKLCAPGKGIFDFKEFISMLKSINYDNNLMVELYSGDYDDYNELQRSVNYLKNIL